MSGLQGNLEAQDPGTTSTISLVLSAGHPSPSSTRRKSWLCSVSGGPTGYRSGLYAFRAWELLKSGLPHFARPGPTGYLRQRKSPTHLGSEMQPPHWHRQLGTTGPLSGDRCQAIKNEVFREKDVSCIFQLPFTQQHPRLTRPTPWKLHRLGQLKMQALSTQGQAQCA